MQLLRASMILFVLLAPQKEARQRYERTDMADLHRWQGSTGSWTLATNWDTGEYPGSNFGDADVGIFDGLSQLSPATDLDLSGDNRLERLLTEPSFTGDIGASGNPLISETAPTATSRVIHRGRGRVYFETIGGGNSNAVCDSPNAKDALTLSGPMGNVFVKNGLCHVTSTAALNFWAVVNGAGARLIIDAPAGAENPPDFLVVVNGVCENKRAFASGDVIVVMGGRLIQTGLVPTGVKLFVTPAGRMDYLPNVSIGSNKPDVLNAGLVDASGSAQDIAFDFFIQAVESATLGAISQSSEPSSLSLTVDLREEHP